MRSGGGGWQMPRRSSVMFIGAMPSAMATSQPLSCRTAVLVLLRSFTSASEPLCRAHARGLSAGDRVGILSRNRIEYVEAYGVSAAGLIALPLNWRLVPRELQIVLENARPSALIVDPTFLPVIAEMRRALPFVRRFSRLDGARDGFGSYEAMLSHGKPAQLDMAVSPEATACFLYTSGTTGIPKGAELIHRGLLLNRRAAVDEISG